MRPRDLLAIAALGLVLALVPLAFPSNTVINALVLALVVALAAQGWNVVGGFGGQFSFGHAAFFGTGAYATALLQARLGVNPWAAFGLGIAAGGALGAAIGWASFRAGLRGSYFALVTLAFAEVLRVLANAAAFTGGAAGVLIPLDPRPERFQFASRSAFYGVVLALVVAVLLLTAHVAHSRFGARLVAVRENEDAARALGVDALAVKVQALALSAAVTAAAGGLYAQYFLYLDAGIAYGTWISIEALIAAVVGGAGTVLGPVLGALALAALGEATKGLAARIPGIDLVAFGALLVLVVGVAPEGLAGLTRRWRRRAA